MNENNMPMNSQEPSTEETCPCCPRHCSLSAPSCGRGEHYASLSPEEREQAAQHGERPEREGEHGHHSHHKPHDDSDPDAEPHSHEGPHGGSRGSHHGQRGPHGESGTEPAPEGTCPCCPRHCSLSEPSCGRGERYASMTPEEREQASQHGERPEREGEHGSHHHHGPRDADQADAEHHPHDGPGHGPHHGPHGDAEPQDPRYHGPHIGPGPEPCGHHGPGLRGDRGPHGGPGPQLPRPVFLEDPDSLSGLMHRCVHTLHHKSDRDRGQKSALAMLYAWGEVDQRTLQEAMGIQPGSVSELLSKLEAKGYITRERSEKDRRMVTVRLTDTGREAAQAMPSDKQDRFAALTQEEQEQLKGLLKKLLESWQ